MKVSCHNRMSLAIVYQQTAVYTKVELKCKLDTQGMDYMLEG